MNPAIAIFPTTTGMDTTLHLDIADLTLTGAGTTAMEATAITVAKGN